MERALDGDRPRIERPRKGNVMKYQRWIDDARLVGSLVGWTVSGGIQSLNEFAGSHFEGVVEAAVRRSLRNSGRRRVAHLRFDGGSVDVPVDALRAALEEPRDDETGGGWDPETRGYATKLGESWTPGVVLALPASRERLAPTAAAGGVG